MQVHLSVLVLTYLDARAIREKGGGGGGGGGGMCPKCLKVLGDERARLACTRSHHAAEAETLQP